MRENVRGNKGSFQVQSVGHKYFNILLFTSAFTYEAASLNIFIKSAVQYTQLISEHTNLRIIGEYTNKI